MHLDGVDSRSAAESLRGARILVPAADLPPAAPDEFYWHEIAGYRVETTGGRALGTIAEVFATGLNDVWVVREGEREHLIPVIADVVRAIHRTERRVVIEPLPGLLD
jgi:16S rRNA processing protein RimM